jgi:pilus assembly protein Flp/PilA
MERALIAVSRFVERDKGQDLLEYGLLVALIAIIIIAAVRSVGTTIGSVFWGYIASVPI